MKCNDDMVGDVCIRGIEDDMVTAVRRLGFAYIHRVFVGGRSGRGLYGEAPDERTDGVSPHGVPSAVEMGGNALGDVMDDTGVGMESWGIGFYDEVETERGSAKGMGDGGFLSGGLFKEEMINTKDGTGKSICPH